MKKRVKKIIQRDRLRDQVYQIVRDDIRAGVFAPGERLVEESVAAQLGVSRTPIREALFQLAQDGLLAESDRGYMLPIRSSEEVADLLELRMLLEPRIVAIAAQDATDKQIKTLGKSLQREKARISAADPAEFIEVNFQFRINLFSMCRNATLTRYALLCADSFQSHRILSFREIANRELTVKYHQKIFDGIKERDPKAAQKAVRDLLKTVQSRARVN